MYHRSQFLVSIDVLKEVALLSRRLHPQSTLLNIFGQGSSETVINFGLQDLR